MAASQVGGLARMPPRLPSVEQAGARVPRLGVPADPRDGSITLADFIAMHWSPERGGAPKTQQNRGRRARLHIVPHLGELPLRSITPAELRSYIAKLEDTVASVGYRRGILSELSSVLEAAVDDKRLARNPMHAKSVSARARFSD
ncbi:N-terminal phage integrase SAM-like domain-containing protein [Streptomyces sp. NRRL F-4489]|uniref:N-terminal phage integrase SAM-like domain-containing protein n=1 Tax=Streptomyces sp. NRRL F-4489 TaxID=1609095 RepID=UPI001F252C3E|nr:N-terminal phage integrase SAM-like domain-containing protein [Streptomyces sp. NRRL F-4489]